MDKFQNEKVNSQCYLAFKINKQSQDWTSLPKTSTKNPKYQMIFSSLESYNKANYKSNFS